MIISKLSLLKYYKTYIAIIIFGLATLELKAQSDPADSDFVIHFEVGWNLFGPTKQMNDHMIEHGYNQTTTGFFGTTFHPKREYITPNIGVGFMKSINNNSSLGLDLNYSQLDRISGSKDNNLLFVNFQSYQITPFYTRKLGASYDLKFGLPIMFNNSKKTNRTGTDVSYNNVGLGLLVGTYFKLHGGSKTLWKIGIDAIITNHQSIGQFPSGIGDNSILPESEVNFSHLRIKLVIALKQ